MCDKLNITAVLIGLICSISAAAPIHFVDGAGDESGWLVSWSGATTGVQLIDVVPGTSMTISATKDFIGHESRGPDAEFSLGTVTFLPAFGKTPVPKIIINSESVANHTGLALREFRWTILPGGTVSFDSTATDPDVWRVLPFTSVNLTTTLGGQTLAASQGAVPNGDTFHPHAGPDADGLVLNASGAFVLKQTVAPEPGVMAMCSLGAACLLRRRRR